MLERAVDSEVKALAERVRAAATYQDAAGLRRAFGQVLTRLQVDSDKPEVWRDGFDIVGAAYERLLSGSQRRAAGQFFTPFWAGDLMAAWLYSNQAELLLDAGCGSGALLITAARHSQRGKTKLLGLDDDSLAIAMAETNKRLRGIRRCELRVGNFLIDDLCERPDRIVCNPPYSRHSAIPRFQKAIIHDELQRVFGVRFGSCTSLQALFLLRALEVSTDDALLAFITPSDWLDVNYGRDVRRCLLERSHIEALIFLDAEHLFFTGARTTAAITLIRKGVEARPTRVIRLGRELPEPAVVLAAIHDEHIDPSIAVEELSLQSEVKWARRVRRQRRGVRLGDVARVHRGIATGANRYFCLSENERLRRGIPRSELRPCLTSPKRFSQVEVTQEVLDHLPDEVRRWLVDSNDPNAQRATSPLGRYLRYGHRIKVRKGYLVSRRTPWYSQEQRQNAPIVFTYLNKNRPRFLRNQAGAVPLNNWLVIAPNEGVDADVLFRALTTLNVLEQLRERARVYGGGLWKLEPSELECVTLSGQFNCEDA